MDGAGSPLVLAGKRAGPRRAVKAGALRHRAPRAATALTARLLRPGIGSPSTNGESGSGTLCERLMRLLTSLGEDVDITVRTKPSNRAHGRIRVIGEAHA